MSNCSVICVKTLTEHKQVQLKTCVVPESVVIYEFRCENSVLWVFNHVIQKTACSGIELARDLKFWLHLVLRQRKSALVGPAVVRLSVCEYGKNILSHEQLILSKY